MGDISALISVSAPPPQQSMPAMLADRLRAAIAEGRLRPGQQLFEQDLAAEFDVSRGPLRKQSNASPKKNSSSTSAIGDSSSPP